MKNKFYSLFAVIFLSSLIIIGIHSKTKALSEPTVGGDVTQSTLNPFTTVNGTIKPRTATNTTLTNLNVTGTCTGCGSGGGSPAGVSGQIQKNLNGSFAAVATGTQGTFLSYDSFGQPNFSIPYTSTACASGCYYTATTTSGLNAAEIGIASSTGSGTLLIKVGTYFNDATLNLLSGINLLGEGYGTIIQGTTTRDGILSNGSSNISIQNIHFDGGFASKAKLNADVLLRLRNSHNITLFNNYVTNSYGFGFFVDSNGANSSSTSITIQNNYLACNGLQDCIGGGPHDSSGLSTSSGVSMLGNHIFQYISTTTVANLDMNCVDMVAVHGMIFSNNDCHGNLTFGNEQTPNTDSQITNNSVFAPIAYLSGTPNYSGQIIFYATNDTSTTTANQNLISGNTLDNGGMDIEGNNSFPIKNLVISNNIITTSTSTYTSADNRAQDCIFATGLIAPKLSGNICTAFSSQPSGTVGFDLNNTTFANSFGNTFNGFATAIDFHSGTSNESQWDIFPVNSNGINIANGGAGIITMDSNGRIGIGTTTPAAQLQVSPGNVSLLMRLQRSTTQPNIYDFRISNDIGSGDQGSLFIQNTGGVNADIGFRASTTGNANLLIRGNGNVGIGTTTPGNTMTVIGDISDSNLTNGNCVQAGVGGILQSASGACGTGGSGNSAWTIGNGLIYDATSTDLVGIGTITPTTTLFVQGKSGTNPFSVASSTGTQILTVLQNSSVVIGTSSNPFINMSLVIANGAGGLALTSSSTIPTTASGESSMFYVNNFNNNEALYIRKSGTGTGDYLTIENSIGSPQFIVKSSGNVGIGSSTPNANLVVQGIGGATQPLFTVATNTGVSLFQVNANGNVGIASATPNYKLSVGGTVAFPNVATASTGLSGYACFDAAGQIIDDTAICVTVSAARFKNEITPLSPQEALAKTLKLQGVSYYFKPDAPGYLPGLQYGLIADSVAKVDPNLAVYEATTTSFEGTTYPAGTVEGLAQPNAWIGLFTADVQALQGEISNITIGKVKRSAEENWQWIAIGLLILGFIYQQKQINKLKKN